MRLLKASFRNFRILRNCEVDFSTDKTKHLTVIRAENETCKTTMLRALTWGLFGDDVLPRKGRSFRIHPLDWDSSESEEIDIRIDIEFEHTWKSSFLTGKKKSETHKYRLIRSTLERITGEDAFERSNSELKLFRITSSGHENVPNPVDRIRQILGSNLKDLFFTDGDDALRFISSRFSKSEKRRMVHNAIRDMLSFKVIEEGMRHVKQTINYIKQEIARETGSEEIEKYALASEEVQKKIELSEGTIKDYQLQLREAENALDKLEAKLEEALKLGDKEKLVHDKELYESQELILKSEIKDLTMGYASCLSSPLLASTLLVTHLKNTYGLLNDLREKGKIPKASLPYLNELLKQGVCICGTELKKGGQHYQTLKILMEEEREHSSLDTRVTDLRFEAQKKHQDIGKGNKNWCIRLVGAAKALDKKKEQQGNVQAVIKRIEKEIANIPDTDIKFLREQRDTARSIRDKIKSELHRERFDLGENLEDKKTIDNIYEKLVKQQEKAKEWLTKIGVAQDIHKVLQETYEDIEKKEIPKVSEMLNRFFIKMIRSDPDKKSAIIQTAFINQNYDIVVLGQKGKELDPDDDLNGASQRALTLSFILALANVSEFVAPNVIDTPLGMMDPLIKESVLTTLMRESNQLVLFLTRSEIRDIEDLLDDYIGEITTAISPVHYPEKLVNKPPKGPIRILQCECNHRQFCKLCELINDSSDDRMQERKQ